MRTSEIAIGSGCSLRMQQRNFHGSARGATDAATGLSSSGAASTLLSGGGSGGSGGGGGGGEPLKSPVARAPAAGGNQLDPVDEFLAKEE